MKYLELVLVIVAIVILLCLVVYVSLSPPVLVVEFACTPIYDVPGYLDFYTGISAHEHYASYCYRARTEPECLGVDYYNEARDDFTTPDGRPDCKWVPAA